MCYMQDLTLKNNAKSYHYAQSHKSIIGATESRAARWSPENPVSCWLFELAILHAFLILDRTSPVIGVRLRQMQYRRRRVALFPARVPASRIAVIPTRRNAQMRVRNRYTAQSGHYLIC